MFYFHIQYCICIYWINLMQFTSRTCKNDVLRSYKMSLTLHFIDANIFSLVILGHFSFLFCSYNGTFILYIIRYNSWKTPWYMYLSLCLEISNYRWYLRSITGASIRLFQSDRKRLNLEILCLETIFMRSFNCVCAKLNVLEMYLYYCLSIYNKRIACLTSLYSLFRF
jgi:hypothetical protein